MAISSNSQNLPEDLLLEILSRLPVKSLMRFKCVCKAWWALASDPTFIAAHLNNNPNRVVSWNGNHNGLIVGHDGFHVFPNCLHELQPVNLTFGLRRKPDLVLGPCDGIFCLHWKPDTMVIGIMNVQGLSNIALWNPATREFSILPMSSFDYPPYKTEADCIVGFGFDHKTKCYKVVKIASVWDEDRVRRFNRVEVYTLPSGTWRVLPSDDIQDVESCSDPRHISTYTKNNGSFHWLLYNNNCDKLVFSFDMSKELFRVTLLPGIYNAFTLEPPSRTKYKECNLTLVRDSLAVICSFFEQGHTSFELWVMKDDDCAVGVEESSSSRWSLELTLKPVIRGLLVSLGFWNNNELLILRDSGFFRWLGRPFLYDPLTKQTRELQISGEPNFIYKESLVSVKGGSGDD